ncbi:MAG: hypothetical protein JF617_11495 [Burkholderiales bacterium]|nr:hypothetical protein [Burkholderiales bacterium]
MINTPLAEQPKIVVLPGSVENAPVYFVDGVAGIALGPAVCRVQFHQVISSNTAEKSEVRKVVVNAVVPTAALVELCVNTLAAISNTAGPLKEVMDAQAEKMFQSLPQLPKSMPAKEARRTSKK